MRKENVSPNRKIEDLIEASKSKEGYLPKIRETIVKNEIPVRRKNGEIHLPILSKSSDFNSCEVNLSHGIKKESLQLPAFGSHDQDLHELEELNENSSYNEYADETLDSRVSSSYFDEDSLDSSELTTTKQNVVLEDREEKEIARKVKKEFKEEFQNIRKETREKQSFLRKKFQSKINSARAALLLARANAERRAIDKLEEEAEKREAGILEKRKMNRYVTLTQNKGDTALELAALRKVRAELDRARARRRSTIASTLIASRRFSLGAAVPDYETKKLENVEEVQKLVFELQNLGLDNAASDLVRSLHNKKNSEEQLKETLKQERENAKIKAMTRRNMEIKRLRQQKLEEKEILEMERIKREREERERLEREMLRRKMKALKRKAFNMSLRKSMEELKLASSISRSYTYSYFNAM